MVLVTSWSKPAELPELLVEGRDGLLGKFVLAGYLPLWFSTGHIFVEEGYPYELEWEKLQNQQVCQLA